MHLALDRLQRVTQRCRRPKALLRIQAHRAAHDSRHGLGNARAVDARHAASRDALGDGLSRVIPIDHLEGRATHEKRPQGRSQGPHVLRGVSARRARNLLGRRPHHREAVAATARVRAHRIGHTEVRQHRRPEGVDHDVAGLNVAVHVARAVQHLSAAAHADHDRQRAVRRHRVCAHLIEDVRDWAVLHHQVRATIRRAPRAVQLGHRRVTRHEGHHVGLAGDAGLTVRSPIPARHLDGHLTAGQFLTAQEHVRETTRPERTNPLVARQRRHHSDASVAIHQRFPFLRPMRVASERPPLRAASAWRRARRRQRSDFSDSA